MDGVIRIANVYHSAFLVGILLLLCCNVSACSSEHDHDDKVLKTVTMPPRAVRRFTFKTSESTTISFNTDLDSKGKDRCKNNGIAMTWLDKSGNGERVTATTSGHIEVVPDKGKVQFRLENLETFPIKVFVSWREK